MKPIVKVLLGVAVAVVIIIGGIIALVVIFALSISTQQGNTTRSTPTTATPARASRQPAERPAQAPRAPEVASFRDGVRTVGSEIQPGTYRTRSRSPGCYWARLAGFSGELGDLIANGTDSPALITISPSDKGFESRRCGTWTADLSAVTKSPSEPFSDGIYMVGVDVAPGTWRADAPESCYWARLRGFSGAMGDLIANENGNGIVTIAASDRGFASQRCGTWSPLR